MTESDFKKAKEMFKEIETLESILNAEKLYVHDLCIDIKFDLEPSVYKDIKKILKERIKTLKIEIDKL